MQIARVVGNAVCASAHKSVRGNALFLCQPIDENGEDCGEIVIAISPFGGGIGSTVLVSTDGSSTADYVSDKHSPLRNAIICILDK